MSLNYKYIDELIDKCLHQQATADERKVLLNLLKYSEDSVLIEKISEAFYASQVETTPPEASWDSIEAQTIGKRKNPILVRVLPKVLMYAAAVALFICLPLYFYKSAQPDQERVSLEKEEVMLIAQAKPAHKSAAASDEIQLELESGKVIDLTAGDSSNIVAVDGALTVVKQGDKLQYFSSSSVSKEKETIIYHRVKVPFGKRIAIVLVDGTSIELNSGSELRYPIYATGGTMDLYLKGEGYFDVTRNEDRLFKVHVDGFGRRKDYTVQVLGTQFNIKSFAEDASSKTTLLTGSIQVEGLSSTPVLLKPSMEIEVDGDYKLGDADLASAMAWREGNFFFKKASLYEVCMELGRWYGVDFQYDKSLSDMDFYFNVSRTKSLADILEMLAAHEQIKITRSKTLIKITKADNQP